MLLTTHFNVDKTVNNSWNEDRLHKNDYKKWFVKHILFLMITLPFIYQKLHLNLSTTIDTFWTVLLLGTSLLGLEVLLYYECALSSLGSCDWLFWSRVKIVKIQVVDVLGTKNSGFGTTNFI